MLKVFYRVMGAALLALLAACGGGSEEPRRVQFFGDSTQWLAFPYIKQRLGELAIDASNNGGQVGKLLAGTDGVNLQPYPATVAAPVLVMNYGMSDAEEPTPLDAYRAGLVEIVHKTPPGVLLVFQTPNPSTQVPPVRQLVADYAQVMREVAAAHRLPLIDVHACLVKRGNWEALLYDGVHPSPEGVRVIVDECLLPELLPLL